MDPRCQGGGKRDQRAGSGTPSGLSKRRGERSGLRSAGWSVGIRWPARLDLVGLEGVSSSSTTPISPPQATLWPTRMADGQSNGRRPYVERKSWWDASPPACPYCCPGRLSLGAARDLRAQVPRWRARAALPVPAIGPDGQPAAELPGPVLERDAGWPPSSGRRARPLRPPASQRRPTGSRALARTGNT